MLCSVGTCHCCISAVKVCQVKSQKCQLAAEELCRMGTLRRGNPFNVGLIFLQGLVGMEAGAAYRGIPGVGSTGVVGELVPGHWCSPSAAPGSAAGRTNAVFSEGSHAKLSL